MKQENKQNQYMQKEFLKFYNSNADAVFRHCYYRISSREKANDVMQEAFMRTWKYLADGNEIKNLKAFVYRVAKNLLIDEYRKNSESSLSAIQEKGYEAPSDSATQRIQKNAENSLLLDSLDKLKEEDKEVIIMRYIDDMRVKDIADILDESENVVSVRIYRAKKRLKKIIKS
ncbi:MAG: sigma-70 family RNA polymerase sigma factor [Candidatus Spechtbacterales bacterium]|nr:sigma-70 family RNA polymerase sigma factor [Candidatus Spechtbacterales bacterium]